MMRMDIRIATFLMAGVMATTMASAQTAPAGPATSTADSANEIVRFTGTVVRGVPNTRPFELRVDRWSTEADRTRVINAFKASDEPAEFADALADLPVIGGFRTISGEANPIRYAEEVTTADGSRALLILSDRQVDYWKGDTTPPGVPEGYTLMEIRFEGDKGEGVVSHGPTDVSIDGRTGTLTITGFEEKPPQLIGVARLEKDDEFDLDEMIDDMVDAVSMK